MTTGRPIDDDRMPAQDPALDAFLASLAETRIPADLAASVAGGVRAHPSRRPSLRLPLLAAAAGLLVVVGGAMAAGWHPPFDIVPGPAGGSASPPRESASAAAPAFEFLRVASAGAPIRTEPGGAGTTIRTVTESDIGRQVLVRERRTVDGKPWVKVEWQGDGEEAAFVWLPETTDSQAPAGYQVTVFQSTTWLPCADGGDKDASVVLGASAAERLACYGGAPFSLGPVVVEPASAPAPGGASGPTDGTPSWLVGPTDRVVMMPPDSIGSIGTVPLRVDPSVALQVPSGPAIRLTGHLDDTASHGCTRSSRDDAIIAGDASDQELWCRQQLVITGWTTADAPTASPAAGVEQYPTLSGQRVSLPTAPIAGRTGEGAAWTDHGFVVWGGQDAAGAPLADGAILDLEGTGGWRTIATSPLSARTEPLVAWTGSELLVWGGHDATGAGFDDGAAWNPVTDRWRRLPPAPLDPHLQQDAAWTGQEWMVMSGAKLAAYRPAGDTWLTRATPPVVPLEDAIRLAWTGDALALLAQGSADARLWTLDPGGRWTGRADPPAGWTLALATGGMGQVFATGFRADTTGGLAALDVDTWDPTTDTWAASDSPLADGGPIAWDEGWVFVVGPDGGAAFYTPDDAWLMLPGTGEDRHRENPSVAWTPAGLIVWGGANPGHGDPQPDGSLYRLTAP